jgi:hypothetical protein
MSDSNTNFTKNQVLNYIEQGGEMLKAAAISASSYIRTRLKEEGLLRKIYTQIKIRPEQLDKSVDSDKPIKIVEKEVDTTAVTLPFRDAPTSEYITGDRYAISFHKVATKKMTKNIYELKTYDNDIRKMLTDNGLKEIQTEEDRTYFGQLDTIVAANPAEQLHAPAGGINKANILDGIKKFQKMTPKVGAGMMVMNNNSLIDVMKNFDLDDVHSLVREFFDQGKVPDSIYGWPLLVTIKDEIVLDNEIYLVSTEDFAGKFYSLEEPTAYMETKDGDTLVWYFWENIGFGIGNTKTVVKMRLTT